MRLQQATATAGPSKHGQVCTGSNHWWPPPRAGCSTRRPSCKVLTAGAQPSADALLGAVALNLAGWRPPQLSVSSGPSLHAASQVCTPPASSQWSAKRLCSRSSSCTATSQPSSLMPSTSRHMVRQPRGWPALGAATRTVRLDEVVGRNATLLPVALTGTSCVYTLEARRCKALSLCRCPSLQLPRRCGWKGTPCWLRRTPLVCSTTPRRRSPASWRPRWALPQLWQQWHLVWRAAAAPAAQLAVLLACRRRQWGCRWGAATRARRWPSRLLRRRACPSPPNQCRQRASRCR